MPVSGIGHPDAGDVIRTMPGAAMDDEAGRTGHNAQRRRIFTVGGNGADAMFGGAPGHHFQQPSTRPDL